MRNATASVNALDTRQFPRGPCPGRSRPRAPSRITAPPTGRQCMARSSWG